MERITRELRFGMKIGDAVHREFEMREATVEDMFEAEQLVDTSRPLAFNGQMMCRQLVRVGSFEGPFTLGMIRKLRPADYAVLRKAQLDLDVLAAGDDEAGEE